MFSKLISWAMFFFRLNFSCSDDPFCLGMHELFWGFKFGIKFIFFLIVKLIILPYCFLINKI